MMASRVMNVFWLLHVSIILLCCFRCNEVMSLQSQSSSSSSSSSSIRKMVNTAIPPSVSLDESEILLSPRRRFVFQVSKMATAVATATILPPHQKCYATAGGITAESARQQWRESVAVLDELLQNWKTDEWAAEVGGGDRIRTKLGTLGTSSSLYQIEKALKALRDSEFVADFVEFQETTDEFMGALFRADSLASSSNNKTGSGKQTPPAVFLEQSKMEVVEMQRLAKKLNAMEPLLMH